MYKLGTAEKKTVRYRLFMCVGVRFYPHVPGVRPPPFVEFIFQISDMYKRPLGKGRK